MGTDMHVAIEMRPARSTHPDDHIWRFGWADIPIDRNYKLFRKFGVRLYDKLPDEKQIFETRGFPITMNQTTASEWKALDQYTMHHRTWISQEEFIEEFANSEFEQFWHIIDGYCLMYEGSYEYRILICFDH